MFANNGSQVIVAAGSNVASENTCLLGNGLNVASTTGHFLRTKGSEVRAAVCGGVWLAFLGDASVIEQIDLSDRRNARCQFSAIREPPRVPGHFGC